MRKTSLNQIYELAKVNDKIIFLGSDLGPNVLSQMKAEFSNRFFMEGISEQHIIGMAAGMALEGYLPYVNTISTFLTRRSFEQLAIDICLHNLPVCLIGNGGGSVYAPLGPTHIAIEDIAILRSLPNMTIIAPCDANEMIRVIKATANYGKPVYIRLAKGGEEIVSKEHIPFQIGKGVILKNIVKNTFITTGVMTQLALKVCKKLEQNGIPCGVLHLHTIKPLDKEILKNNLPNLHSIVTVEEHKKEGGLGSSILEFCNEHMPEQCSKIKRIGIPDAFPEEYGRQESLLDYWDINENNLYNQILKAQ